MRHRQHSASNFNRHPAHRRAMIRNLVINLFTWGPAEVEAHRKAHIKHHLKPYQIRTTLQKAKAARPLAEKLITLGKKGRLHDRRRAIILLGGNLRAKQIVKKLFRDIAPRYRERNGGYTRLVRLPETVRLPAAENEVGAGKKRSRFYGTRLGDQATLVLLELVEEGPPGRREKARGVRKPPPPEAPPPVSPAPPEATAKPEDAAPPSPEAPVEKGFAGSSMETPAAEVAEAASEADTARKPTESAAQAKGAGQNTAGEPPSS